MSHDLRRHWGKLLCLRGVCVTLALLLSEWCAPIRHGTLARRLSECADISEDDKGIKCEKVALPPFSFSQGNGNNSETLVIICEMGRRRQEEGRIKVPIMSISSNFPHIGS
jgi:hypothetical protein